MPGTNRTAIALDDTSKAIIEQLQADGRRSYADIGRSVGLSEAATRQRVQRLVDSGVMQIVAVTLAELPSVSYVVMTAGSFDLLAEVVCTSDDELIGILNRDIRGLDGVVSTETFVYLKLHKPLYDWGTR